MGGRAGRNRVNGGCKDEREQGASSVDFVGCSLMQAERVYAKSSWSSANGPSETGCVPVLKLTYLDSRREFPVSTSIELACICILY